LKKKIAPQPLPSHTCVSASHSKDESQTRAVLPKNYSATAKCALINPIMNEDENLFFLGLKYLFSFCLDEKPFFFLSRGAIIIISFVF